MGAVTPFRRPPDALQASATLFLRTGDPVARAAAVAAWRARYQPVAAPFVETVPMPQLSGNPGHLRDDWDRLPSDCNVKETDHA